MPYCTNCGAQYDDGAKFCPTCGATTGETAQSNAQQNAAYTTPTQPAQQPVQTDNSKTMAILAVVFPILFFLPSDQPQDRVRHLLGQSGAASAAS